MRALPLAVPSNQTNRNPDRSTVTVAPSRFSDSAVQPGGRVSSMRKKAPGSRPETTTVTVATSGPSAETSRRAVVGPVGAWKAAGRAAGCRATSLRWPLTSNERVGASALVRYPLSAATRTPTLRAGTAGNVSHTYRTLAPFRTKRPPRAMGETRVRPSGSVSSKRAEVGASVQCTVQTMSPTSPGDK